MEATMSPRDIQLRIRSGESLADVIAASGLPADRVEVFAGPILAEREHTTATALSAPVRRRGETASARRLRQTVAESLLDQGYDIDFVTWDSWRRSDGRWIVQGDWQGTDEPLTARFLYDTKGRFSTAENDQARLLIGDLPLVAPVNIEGEPTLRVEPRLGLDQSDLAEETTLGLSHEPEHPADDEENEENEDSVRSDLDLLYDMISTIDEDSVRIFRGLREPLAPDGQSDNQPSLIDGSELPQPAKAEHPADHEHKSRRGRKRASVPSWDDIIFGGQS